MSQAALLMINAALCAGILWGCICRLRLTTKDTRPAVRFQFVLLSAAAGFSTLQPWLVGELPGYADVVLAATVCVGLWTGRRRWAQAMPVETASGPMPFDDHLHSMACGRKARD